MTSKVYILNQQTAGYRDSLRWGLLAGFLLTVSFPLCAEREQSILFGVFPYLPPARLEQIYAPVAADLSEAIGHPVQLRTRPTFSLFRKELENETYDLVFIQPFAYVESAAPHGYRLISRWGQPIAALFVTRIDSRVATMSDLSNEIIAAPPIRAAVSLLGRQALLNNHLIPGENVRLTYQNSHDACLRQVLIHKAAACITAKSPLEVFQAQSGVNFRVVANSQPIPGPAYAVHNRVPEQIRDTLRQRTTQWAQTTRGRALLNSIKVSGFVSVVDEDYDVVRYILKQSQKTTE